MANYNKKLTDTELRIYCRYSYLSVFKPRAPKDGAGDPKYQCTCLVDKKDTAAVQMIREAEEAAKKLYREKFGKTLSPRAKNVIYDGDIDFPDNPECEGKLVIRSASKRKPVVQVMENGTRVDALDEEDVKSGDYGVAVINFYPYDSGSAQGITAGLNAILKLEDGEALGGGSFNADAAFGDI